MDTRGVNFTSSKKVLGVLTAFACAWVSASAYLAVSSDFQNRPLDDKSVFATFKLFSDGRVAVTSELDSQARLLAQPLEFMVWPAERQQASKALIAVLQQQLNLEPLNARLWVQLSLAQADAQTDIATRIWTLRQGLAVSRWDDEQRLLLTRHCVVEYDDFMQHASDLCKGLLRRIPLQKPLHRLARGMGVRVDYLKVILERQGLLKLDEVSQ